MLKIKFETKGYKNHFRKGTCVGLSGEAEKIRGILNPKTWFTEVIHSRGTWIYPDGTGFTFNEGGWPLNFCVHHEFRYIFFFGLRITWGR